MKIPVFKSYAPVLAILMLGLAVRLYQPFHTPFGFDQVQILEAAEQIQRGEIALIGPRTGPATLFTGPLIYYMTAVFGLIFPLQRALVATAAFFSLATGVVLWFLAQKYLTTNHAIGILCIWAASPLLITLDRIVWNPNILILAATLSFFPLLKVKSLTIKDGILLALGVFFGYQAHFSGLVLLPFVAIGLLIRTVQKIDSVSKSSMIFSLSLFGLLVSITPTILFDFRHDFLNFQGLVSFSQNSDKVSVHQALLRITEKFFIVFETSGKLLFLGGSAALLFISGFSLFLSWLFYTRKLLHSHTVLIPLSWLAAVSFLYSLYRESTPEYYYLLLVPTFLYIFVAVFTHVCTQFQQGALLILFLIYGSLFSYWEFSSSKIFDLATQLQTIAEIKNIRASNGVTAYEYDMEHIDSIGITYLLEYVGVDLPKVDSDTKQANNLDGSGELVLAIKYPIGDSQLLTAIVDDSVGLWLDSRSNQNRSYLSTDEYIISGPSDFSFYTTSSKHSLDFATTKHTVLRTSQDQVSLAGELFVLDVHTDAQKVALFKEKVASGELVILFERNTFIFSTVGRGLDELELVEVTSGKSK